MDCPTCGRTIRVPDLDGTVKPLPKPGLDPKDSKLAAALNELASIGEGDNAFADSPANAERKTGVPSSDSGGRRPSPHLREFVVLGTDGQPVDFDALPPREGIAPEGPDAPPAAAVHTLDEVPRPLPAAKLPPPPLDPPHSAKPQAQLPDNGSFKQDRPWAETAQPGDSWNQLIAAARQSSDSESARPDEPSGSKPELKPASSSPTATPASKPSGPSAGLVVMVTGAVAVIFAVGFWVGRVTTVSDRPSNSPAGGDPKAVPEEPQDANQPDETVAAAKPAFRGRITFLSDGQRRPDRGARVIVLPRDRSGSAKIAIAGFRSGDSPEDHRVSVAALTAMGGAFATASDEGEFEVSLPASGQFYVLVLSNSLTREAEEIGASVEDAVSPYFDRPSQLIGRVRCYVEEVRWGGEGTEPWDYSFGS